MATLLLHGFTGSSLSWGDPVVDGLASAVGAPLLVDLPGHGRNVGDASPASHALTAVEAEITRLAGEEPLDLIGYSMGGRLALAYAARHPGRVRRLVLESASPGLATEAERVARRDADELLARRLERDGIEAFVAYWEGIPLFESQTALPESVRAGQRARRLLNRPEALAASLRGLGTGSLPPFWEDLPGLDVPVLLVVGALDRKFVGLAERMSRLLPRAVLAVVAGAGHTVHLERPEAWLQAVIPFLSEGGGEA